jgi:hypothetical protein
LLSSTQEDKSLQQPVNLFKQVYEEQSRHLQAEEHKRMEEEKAMDRESARRTGRPKLYKSKLSKSKTNVLSSSPVAYGNSGSRLPPDPVKSVFDYSADFGELSRESRYGLNCYSTDGIHTVTGYGKRIRA